MKLKIYVIAELEDPADPAPPSGRWVGSLKFSALDPRTVKRRTFMSEELDVSGVERADQVVKRVRQLCGQGMSEFWSSEPSVQCGRCGARHLIGSLCSCQLNNRPWGLSCKVTPATQPADTARAPGSDAFEPIVRCERCGAGHWMGSYCVCDPRYQPAAVVPHPTAPQEDQNQPNPAYVKACPPCERPLG